MRQDPVVALGNDLLRHGKKLGQGFAADPRIDIGRLASVRVFVLADGLQPEKTQSPARLYALIGYRASIIACRRTGRVSLSGSGGCGGGARENAGTASASGETKPAASQSGNISRLPVLMAPASQQSLTFAFLRSRENFVDVCAAR